MQRLRASPVDGSAFRVLGVAAQAEGDHSSAMRLYGIAMRRNPRDARTRLWLADAALARGEIDSAMRNLDAALRVDPDRSEPMLRRVLRSLANPAIRKALGARLVDEPAWRDRLPALLVGADPGVAQQLLAELSVRPLRPAELESRISLLETLGRPTEARAAWSAALPASARLLDGRVFDGGFESGEGPEPYGWRLPSSPEVLVGLEASSVAQGRSALWVLVQGREIVLPDVSQRLVLAAGSYSLSVQANGMLTGSGRGFAWELSCRDDSLQLAKLALPKQSAGWQSFAVQLTVPPDCPMQILRLVHEGRNLSERSLTGRLGIDAIKILPEPG
ncbi:hypothetical protein BH11PSE14_BH11PSE14_02820 [soil metagenome]